MMTLNNLQSPRGANKDNKRIGRGQGSGQGTQAGKGHKGQKARKSGHVRTGFEGNNLPLYMRLPKRGFNNTVFAESIIAVSLKLIANNFKAKEVVSRETLVEKGVLKGSNKSKTIKIIGNDQVEAGLVFEGIKSFSGSAKSVLEKNSCVIK